MEIEIFNAVLIGDIYDGDNWVKSHTSLSKKDILDWVNTSIDTLASECTDRRCKEIHLA